MFHRTNRKLPFFETSAKQGININEAFQACTKQYLSKIKIPAPSPNLNHKKCYIM